MELIPVLDDSLVPAPGSWYVISSDNNSEAPSARVGHTAVPDSIRNPLHVYLFGGANPDNVFSDTYKLNWPSLKWHCECSHDSSLGRYEHASGLLYSSHSGSPSSNTTTTTKVAASEGGGAYLCAFGGASKSENMNSTMCWSTEEKEWHTLELHSQSQRAPKPRTHHAACVLPSLQDSNKSQWLVIFSGGSVGSEPIKDTQIYLLSLREINGKNKTKEKATLSDDLDKQKCSSSSHPPALPIESHWLHVFVSGKSPKPRTGHVMVTVDANTLLLHGGMAGNTFLDDLHQLNIQWQQDAHGNVVGASGTWKEITWKGKGNVPSARAAHGAVFVPAPVADATGASGGGSLYLFGGLTANGAADDAMFTFDLRARLWSRVNYVGSAPESRLDFAYTLIQQDFPLCETKNTNGQGDEQENSQGKIQRNLLFVHGGMDTVGNLFDDTLLFVLPQQAHSS